LRVSISGEQPQFLTLAQFHRLRLTGQKSLHLSSWNINRNSQNHSQSPSLPISHSVLTLALAVTLQLPDDLPHEIQALRAYVNAGPAAGEARSELAMT